MSILLVLTNAQVQAQDWKIQDANEYSKWSLVHKRDVFNNLPIPMQNFTLLSFGIQDSDKEVRFLATAAAMYSFGTMQELKRTGIKCPYQISKKDFNSIQEGLIKNLDNPDESVRFVSVKALVVSDARSKKIESLLLGELLRQSSIESKSELVEWMLRYGYNSLELEKTMLKFWESGLSTNQPVFPTQSLLIPN